MHSSPLPQPSSRAERGRPRIQAMILAIFVVLGWQFFGQGFGANSYEDASINAELCATNQTFYELNCAGQPLVSGPLASMPDSMWCDPPSLAGFDPTVPDYLTWYFVIGVYNAPLNILCLVNVHIRPRDFLGPFIVGQASRRLAVTPSNSLNPTLAPTLAQPPCASSARRGRRHSPLVTRRQPLAVNPYPDLASSAGPLQAGLLVLGYLQFQCTDDTCALPAVLQNIIAAFVATSVAMGVEFLSSLPSAISVTPSVLRLFATSTAPRTAQSVIAPRSASSPSPHRPLPKQPSTTRAVSEVNVYLRAGDPRALHLRARLRRRHVLPRAHPRGRGRHGHARQSSDAVGVDHDAGRHVYGRHLPRAGDEFLRAS